MNITPELAAMTESIEAKLRRCVAMYYVNGSRFQRQHAHALMTKAACEIEQLRKQVAELEAQLADMRRDLSDARSGWESAVAEVRELEARDATDCPHIRPYMTAVDDAESFESWLSRASDAELRCAVALQRGEIDRLRLEPMRAAADTLRAMAEQHRIKNTCNGHWCASNADEVNRLLWVALLETADAMESKHESA